MTTSLRISGVHFDLLRAHLFPGDQLEAVAFALCGRHHGESGDLLLVHRVVPVPYEVCTRAVDRVTWSSTLLPSLLDDAKRKGFGIVKFHSHPGSFARFSTYDDESDRETFASVFSWLDDDKVHGSAVMLADGRLFGRTIGLQGWSPLGAIGVLGENISIWHQDSNDVIDPAAAALEAHQQLFGAGTTARLRKLRIGVVGASGTGSIVIELLARLGVGGLTLVDDQDIENRNLNRILNSTKSDVGHPKVDVIAEAVRQMGLGTDVLPLAMNLYDPRAVRAIGGCDVVFGCVDSAEGRHLLNRIATFYVIPYFDLGVHLAADGEGGIDEASGVVHYLQPGRSSLLSRRAYTLERVRAENLRRTDPAAYAEQRKVDYIENVDERSPAVVSVNATIASIAVNEFLARIHPFRSCSNYECATIRYNFMETLVTREDEESVDSILAPHVGRGDIVPLLDWPSLSD